MKTPLIILSLLTGPWLLAQLVFPGDALRTDHFGLAGVVLAFTFFGIGHFAKTEQMVDMLPPQIPFRRAIVLATGVLEFALALAVALPVTRGAAGLACVAVLIGFFPANIYAAIHRRGGGGHDWGPAYLLVRFPLQVILVLWCLAFTQ